MIFMPSDYPHLYRYSMNEAEQYDEVSQWQESHNLNIACSNAIEEAIRKGFDGMLLKSNCAKGVIEDYGFMRTGWVLSHTIQEKNDEEEISPSNKAWARQTFIPSSDRNYDFVVGSHPALLNDFVSKFRDALTELHLFDYFHCDSCADEDLTGKVLIIRHSALKESYWVPENQLWYATGGFGCSPYAAGDGIYATWLVNGEKYRWSRADFFGVIKDEHLPDWAREQVEKLKSGQEITSATPGLHR